MSNYNSTHTGAELDEAVGRVLDGGSIKVQTDTNTADITILKGRMTTAEEELEFVESAISPSGGSSEVTLDLASGTAITNKWYLDSTYSQWINSDATTWGSVVDVSSYRGREFFFTRDKTQYCRYGWLKNINGINTLYTPANFCTGQSLQKYSPNQGDASYTGVVPDDASYFYCAVRISGTDITQSLKISAEQGGGIDLSLLHTTDKSCLINAINEIADRDTSVDQEARDAIGIGDGQQTTYTPDLTSGIANTNKWYLGSSDSHWTNTDATTWGSAVNVSAFRGGSFTFTRLTSQLCRFGWLKSLNGIGKAWAQSAADFCTGESLNVISANSGSASYTGVVPSDASFFYCATKISGTDITMSLTIELDESGLERLHTTDKSNLVNAINETYDIASSGGSGSATKEIALVGGKLTNAGLPVGSLTARTNFMCAYHTPRLIRCASISSVTLLTGETMRIFCFSGNTLLTTVSDVSNIPAEADGFMIEVSSSAEYTTGRKLTLSLVGYRGEVALDGLRSTPIFLSYEVQVPNISVNGLLAERHYDNGYVMLPPNYSPDGEPCPIAMFCHGSEGYKFGETTIQNYQAYLTYVCNNGYIVCDCNGITDKYMISGGSLANNHDVEFCPVGLASRKGLYEAITAHFNARTDGVYLFGKSMGGLMVGLLAYHQPFKVRCVGALAPAIASVVAQARWMANEEVDFVKQQFGITGTWPAYNGWSGSAATAGKATILANIDKFCGYDPFFAGSDLDPVEMVNTAYAYTLFNINETDVWALVNASHKYQPCPIKIWGAADDASTPYPIWQMYKKMVDNAFGLCELRTMPNDTGGHNSVDSSPQALQATVTPKHGTEVTVPLAYAELVEWFGRW